MTIDVAQQGRALCQALLLGAVLGMLYDLFRILRVRVRVPVLGPVLDLLFWTVATLALFLWSQQAWGGEIRLYGAFFCVAGGAAYFWTVSHFFLWLAYRMADLTALLLGILTVPLRLLRALLKKIRKLGKNTFLFGGKWYRIRHKIGSMEQAYQRRLVREGRERSYAVQTSRFFDQDRGPGSADLYGHRSHGSPGPDPYHPEPAGRPAQQVADQRLENQELADAIENSDDPEMLERVAREKGYVKQNELLFYNVAN